MVVVAGQLTTRSSSTSFSAASFVSVLFKMQWCARIAQSSDAITAWESGSRRQGLSVHIAEPACVLINSCRVASLLMSCKWCNSRRIRPNSAGKSSVNNTTQRWAITAKHARFLSAQTVVFLENSISSIRSRSLRKSTKSMLTWSVEKPVVWVAGFVTLKTISVRYKDLSRKFKRRNKTESRNWIPLLRIFRPN